MKKTEIINQIASEHLIEKIVYKISNQRSDYLQDLINDIYLSLLEKPDEKVEELYETATLPFFIIRMVKNNLQSTHSPYYRNYCVWEQNKSQLNESFTNLSDGE